MLYNMNTMTSFPKPLYLFIHQARTMTMMIIIRPRMLPRMMKTETDYKISI